MYRLLFIFLFSSLIAFEPEVEVRLNEQNQPIYLRVADWEQTITWSDGHIVSIDAQDPLGMTSSLYTYENNYLASDLNHHYTYDSSGNRTDTVMGSEQTYHIHGVQTDYYLWENGQEVGRTDLDGNIIEYKKDYTHFALLFLEGKTWIAPLNHRRDICGLIDPDSGEAVAVARYSTWGERTWVSLREDAPYCPWGFNSARIDQESGLIAFERRLYNPRTGRWLTEDPAGTIDHDNKMVFARNDPVSRNELFGLFSVQAGWQFLERNLPPVTKGLHLIGNLLQDAYERHTDLSVIRTGIGEGIVNLTGWGAPKSSRDVAGKGELSNNIRISWINGMLNYHEDSLSTADEICIQHGGNNVHYIHMSTYGYSGDLAMVGWHKLSLHSYSAKMLVKLWRELIEEMGGIEEEGKILHYCHSAGVVVTSVALTMLNEKELAKLDIHAFGGPTLLQRGTNYLAYRDPIGYIGVLTHYILLHPLRGHSANINWQPSEEGIVDHSMTGKTYKKVINTLGNAFVQEHGTLLELDYSK